MERTNYRVDPKLNNKVIRAVLLYDTDTMKVSDLLSVNTISLMLQKGIDIAGAHLGSPYRQAKGWKYPVIFTQQNFDWRILPQVDEYKNLIVDGAPVVIGKVKDSDEFITVNYKGELGRMKKEQADYSKYSGVTKSNKICKICRKEFVIA